MQYTNLKLAMSSHVTHWHLSVPERAVLLGANLSQSHVSPFWIMSKLLLSASVYVHLLLCEISMTGTADGQQPIPAATPIPPNSHPPDAPTSNKKRAASGEVDCPDGHEKNRRLEQGW
jgi:hypothetical protein